MSIPNSYKKNWKKLERLIYLLTYLLNCLIKTNFIDAIFAKDLSLAEWKIGEMTLLDFGPEI